MENVVVLTKTLDDGRTCRIEYHGESLVAAIDGEQPATIPNGGPYRLPQPVNGNRYALSLGDGRAIGLTSAEHARVATARKERSRAAAYERDQEYRRERAADPTAPTFAQIDYVSHLWEISHPGIPQRAWKDMTRAEISAEIDYLKEEYGL